LGFSGVDYGTPYHHTFSAEIVDLEKPDKQEKQHQMSQVSDEYRHRLLETVCVKTTYAPDVLILAQY
jgi:hypothetical protein